VTFDGNTSSVDLLLRDAAGSIDTMVLATGGVVTKKYEPFGARRFAHSIAADSTPPPTTLAEGFAGGYEDAFGLVDLGGRVYSPRLHWFTSADLLVTEPDKSQAWNRTGYAWNNPVSYVDATGFCREPSSQYETVVCLRCSVAERSFSLLDHVQMLIKPMAQPLLRNGR